MYFLVVNYKFRRVKLIKESFRCYFGLVNFSSVSSSTFSNVIDFDSFNADWWDW